jgi:hypothetical protein
MGASTAGTYVNPDAVAELGGPMTVYDPVETLTETPRHTASVHAFVPAAGAWVAFELLGLEPPRAL